MERSPHAFDFLDESSLEEIPPVTVIFGDEPFLKRLVQRRLLAALFGDDDDQPVTILDGSEVAWRDVSDELATKSLFGPSLRVVMIRDADDFVSEHRSQLEDYVAAPYGAAQMILSVKSFPGNTRLAKAVAKNGLIIACKAPERKAGKKSVVDTGRLLKWIKSWAKSEHGLKLSQAAVNQLTDLVGTELGLLNQELTKLALTVEDPKKEIDGDTVVTIVGGWRTKTTWDLLDAACEGNAAEALTQLDRILMAGEHPQALFGAFSWSLRRYAAATRNIEKMERAGQRVHLPTALLAAGFRKFPSSAIQNAEMQLRQMGRQRAGKLYQWLLDIDVKLKSTHSTADRARFALETLLLKLAKEAKPAKR
jgi:DNA polymerase-3 subunit delta